MPEDIYILEVAQKGDYEDFYERPRSIAAWSHDEDALKEFWEDLPVSGSFEDKPLKTLEGVEYIEGNVYRVPHLSEVP